VLGPFLSIFRFRYHNLSVYFVTGHTEFGRTNQVQRYKEFQNRFFYCLGMVSNLKNAPEKYPKRDLTCSCPGPFKCKVCRTSYSNTEDTLLVATKNIINYVSEITSLYEKK
jgi:hypothetical protein